MWEREGAGGDVFTGNDRDAAESVSCDSGRVRGTDRKDESCSRKMWSETVAPRGSAGAGTPDRDRRGTGRSAEWGHCRDL